MHGEMLDALGRERRISKQDDFLKQKMLTCAELTICKRGFCAPNRNGGFCAPNRSPVKAYLLLIIL